MTTTDSPSFTVGEIAERYRVDPHTVLAWIRSGELAAFNAGRKRVAGKPRWRVTPEALARFESSRRPEPEQPPQKRRRKRLGNYRTWFPES